MEIWFLVCRIPIEVNTASFQTPPQKILGKVIALITRSVPLETLVVFSKSLFPHFTAYRQLPQGFCDTGAVQIRNAAELPKECVLALYTSR